MVKRVSPEGPSLRPCGRSSSGASEALTASTLASRARRPSSPQLATTTTLNPTLTIRRLNSMRAACCKRCAALEVLGIREYSVQ